MALPNLWKLYNLRSSPYFQTTLHQGSHATPTHLFVGRKRERQQSLSTIGGGRSSRQAVTGRPGLGKTTLVQAVKADALAAGYWVADELVSILPGSSSEVLAGDSCWLAPTMPSWPASPTLPVRRCRQHNSWCAASDYNIGAPACRWQGLAVVVAGRR